jgi:hypothetical protein
MHIRVNEYMFNAFSLTDIVHSNLREKYYPQLIFMLVF